MTNSPTFDQQLALNAYWKEIGGLTMLPGTNRAADRFARAAFYVSNLPQTADSKRAVAQIFSVIRGVSVPLGFTVPDKPNIASTIWRTVYDHKNRVMYFDSATSPTVFWLPLDSLSFDAGAPSEATCPQGWRDLQRRRFGLPETGRAICLSPGEARLTRVAREPLASLRRSSSRSRPDSHASDDAVSPMRTGKTHRLKTSTTRRGSEGLPVPGSRRC